MEAPLQSHKISQGIEEIEEYNLLSLQEDSWRRGRSAVTGLMTIGNGERGK